jgi:hypothetical protein
MSDIWQRIKNNYTMLSHLQQDRRPDAKKIGVAMLQILPFVKDLSEAKGISVWLSHSTLCFSSRGDTLDITLTAVSETEYELEIYNDDGVLVLQTTNDMQQTLILLNENF